MQIMLAKLLSRAAALQSRAVPVSRFEFHEVLSEGVQASNLDGLALARELWRAVFPMGQATEASPPDSVVDFPALWFAHNPDKATSTPDAATADVWLVRGRTTGTFLLENSEGKNQTLDPQSIRAGRLLILRTETAVQDISSYTRGKSMGPARAAFIGALIKRKRVFFEAGAATILLGVFGLASSLYTMQVYDRVIPLSGYATLVVLTVGVLVALLMELLIRQVRASMTERVCKVIDYELSDMLFAKALSIRLDKRPKSVGTFASQIRHFEFIRNFLTSTSLLVIADIPLGLLFIAVIGVIAGPIALLPLLAIPLALAAGLSFRGKIWALNKVHIEESNHKNGLLIEAIDGVESLKAAGAEWKVQAQWNGLTRLLADKELDLRLINTFATQLTQSVHQLTYIAVIAAGAFAVINGDLTMGGLIACSIISGRALQPIAQLPSVLAQWQASEVSLQALDYIMALPDDREKGSQLILPESCQGNLSLKAASFNYDDDQVVLEIPQLQINQAERVAIVGAVGCGKSTLLKILAGLYWPTQGRCFLDNIEMTQIAPEFVRENIGYLPQDIRLFKGTLRDNLSLGLPTPTDATILRAATACGLISAISKHPKGLDLPIQEGGRGLSGGQKQLVGLARMLIAKPRVLLLDEPTASMDNEIEAFVLKHLFEDLPKHTTVVMATHKAGVLRYVDRIIVLGNNTILVDGPRDAVLAKLQSLQNQPPAAGSASLPGSVS